MPWKQTTLTHLWPSASPPAPPDESPASEDVALKPPSAAAPPPVAPAPAKSSPASVPPSRIFQDAAIPAAASVEPLTEANLLAFRRIFKTLLPVRYPDKTYAKIVANEARNQIARVLVWRDSKAPPAACSAESTRGIVVGAVCARVQPIVTGTADPTPTGDSEVYIQMLGVLAPYRTQGLASALLKHVTRVAAAEHSAKYIVAHVWEASEEALEWYLRRGFTVAGVVENYYQQLRPRGATMVRKQIAVRDLL